MAQKNKNITTKKTKKSVKPVEAPVEQVVVETVEETKTQKEKPEEKINPTNSFCRIACSICFFSFTSIASNPFCVIYLVFKVLHLH